MRAHCCSTHVTVAVSHIFCRVSTSLSLGRFLFSSLVIAHRNSFKYGALRLSGKWENLCLWPYHSSLSSLSVQRQHYPTLHPGNDSLAALTVPRNKSQSPTRVADWVSDGLTFSMANSTIADSDFTVYHESPRGERHIIFSHRSDWLIG